VIDIFRWTDIAEAGIAVLNPLSEEKLALLGEIAGLRPGSTQLDLGCGKGEMLVQYALRHGITGVGIDIYAPLVEDAERRARDAGVADDVRFVVGDAGAHTEAGAFDVVSCIGSAWVGGDFVGTLQLMQRSLADGGRILVGEPFTEIGGILGSLESAGLDLVEMVIASDDDWDRYYSRQWSNVVTWLRTHPDDADVAAVREWLDRDRHQYLDHDRGAVGWGVFVAVRRD
jgi:ubiquinone/menaquinone biosynthesis C-methylase UbiE